VPFAPLNVRLDVTQNKNSVEGKGQVALAGGKAAAAVAGRFDLARRQGELHLGPASLAFAGGALQPADLAPALVALGKAEGTVLAEATIGYDSPSGAMARGQVVFDRFSFETPQVKVEGLAGTLYFVDLLRPRTAPQQYLTAKRVTAVQALDDVALSLGLAMEESGPVVAIGEASGHIAGGTLALHDAALRLGAPSNAATVEVNGISLARLFEELGTESVSGTGILSGSIPLRFGEAGLAVEGGKIRAQDKGELHVKLGSAKETLEKQGQAMSLMVQALEDFRYTLLEVGVSRPAGADMTVAVTLEGMNPAVLEGYPFRFNINLTGDLERLIAALRAGRGLTAEVLERTMDLTR
jgi:hypothetical protein